MSATVSHTESPGALNTSDAGLLSASEPTVAADGLRVGPTRTHQHFAAKVNWFSLSHHVVQLLQLRQIARQYFQSVELGMSVTVLTVKTHKIIRLHVFMSHSGLQ